MKSLDDRLSVEAAYDLECETPEYLEDESVLEYWSRVYGATYSIYIPEPEEEAIEFPHHLWSLPGGQFTDAPIAHHRGRWDLADATIGIYRSAEKPMVAEDHRFEIDSTTGLWALSDDDF